MEIHYCIMLPTRVQENVMWKRKEMLKSFTLIVIHSNIFPMLPKSNLSICNYFMSFPLESQFKIFDNKNVCLFDSQGFTNE